MTQLATQVALTALGLPPAQSIVLLLGHLARRIGRTCRRAVSPSAPVKADKWSILQARSGTAGLPISYTLGHRWDVVITTTGLDPQ